jgi:hypothetical protein
MDLERHCRCSEHRFPSSGVALTERLLGRLALFMHAPTIGPCLLDPSGQWRIDVLSVCDDEDVLLKMRATLVRSVRPAEHGGAPIFASPDGDGTRRVQIRRVYERRGLSASLFGDRFVLKVCRRRRVAEKCEGI